MVRVITQILVGLMLLFGALNLMAKALVHLRNRGVPRALYFLILSAIALFFSVLAFYYAYSGLTERGDKGGYPARMASVLDRYCLP